MNHIEVWGKPGGNRWGKDENCNAHRKALWDKQTTISSGDKDLQREQRHTEKYWTEGGELSDLWN